MGRFRRLGRGGVGNFFREKLFSTRFSQKYDFLKIFIFWPGLRIFFGNFLVADVSGVASLRRYIKRIERARDARFDLSGRL